MIQFHQVYKSYSHKNVVENFTLKISEGEHIVLLGPSGSGKTTLLRMINGLVRPSSGVISINNKEVFNHSIKELRRSIGYVLQRNSLFPHYNVEENISVVPKLLNWDKKRIHERVLEIIDKVGLSQDFLSRSPEKLSGGEAQRVNIARALAADPPILLMDEPFSALDTLSKKSIREEIMSLDEFRKKTVVMISHDIQEAFELAETVAVLSQGKLIQHGKRAELLYFPENDFVKDFLSDAFLDLSLKNISIEQLWRYLPNTVFKYDKETKTVMGNTLWEIMQLFLTGNLDNKPLIYQHKTSGEFKRINWSMLMDAYWLYQKQTFNE